MNGMSPLPSLTPQRVAEMFQGDPVYDVRDVTGAMASKALESQLPRPNQIWVFARTEENAAVYDHFLYDRFHFPSRDDADPLLLGCSRDGRVTG